MWPWVVVRPVVLPRGVPLALQPPSRMVARLLGLTEWVSVVLRPPSKPRRVMARLVVLPRGVPLALRPPSK